MISHFGTQEYRAPGNNSLTWLMMVLQTAQVYTLGKQPKGKFSRCLLIDIGTGDSFQLSTASRSPATLPHKLPHDGYCHYFYGLSRWHSHPLRLVHVHGASLDPWAKHDPPSDPDIP